MDRRMGGKDRRKDGKATGKTGSCFLFLFFIRVVFLFSLVAYLGSFFTLYFSSSSRLLKLKLGLYFLVCLVYLCILKGEGGAKEGKMEKNSRPYDEHHNIWFLG